MTGYNSWGSPCVTLRRSRPADLPRERVEIDLTEAEKACCQRPRIRIGADMSERLDYRPASLFVRRIVRPSYACRFCERAGTTRRWSSPRSRPSRSRGGRPRAQEDTRQTPK